VPGLKVHLGNLFARIPPMKSVDDLRDLHLVSTLPDRGWSASQRGGAAVAG
jgi:hypothetical protein